MMVQIGKHYIPISNIVDIEFQDDAVIVNRIHGGFIRHEFESELDEIIVSNEVESLKDFGQSLEKLASAVEVISETLEELKKALESVNTNLYHLADK